MNDRSTVSNGGDRFLHVLVLVALVVATPLCELMRRFPEFLWAHGVGTGALVALVAGLLFVVPLPLVLVLAVERSMRRSIGPLTMLGIGVPSAALALQALVKAGATGWTPVIGAVVLGGTASLLYLRWGGMRRYVGLLLLVALVAPARLLWSAVGEGGGGAGDEVELGRTGNRAPIVFVVFDELPMISLLDEDESWDEKNFPNFARLAATAHSFARARSLRAATLVALPAMLTAKEPGRRQAPTLENFPRNLFTLFGGDHRIWAVEPATELCPSAINRWHDSADGFDLAVLASDLWVLWHSVTVPAPWVEELPDPGSAWRGFAGAEGEESVPAEPRPRKGREEGDEFRQHYERLKAVTNAMPEARGSIFRRFVASIGTPGDRLGTREVHFLHTMLPHGPFIYLPSGARYSNGGPPWPLARGPTWSEQGESVALVYQRHLLQARYADRLLGELLDRLEEVGRFDSSLIVVTADHGASFRPGQAKRGAAEDSPGETLWVPLLVKAPGQRRPESHRQSVTTTSILPTIVDLLDVESPWPMKTLSALAPAADTARETPAASALPEGAAEAFAWKRSTFGAELSIDPPLRVNRHADLIGRPVDSLPVSGKTEIEMVELEPALVLEEGPETTVRPIWISGSLRLKRYLDCCELLFALQGRIVAAQRTHPTADESMVRFEALLPESSLEPGPNPLRVFVVAGGGSQRRLLVPRYRGPTG